MKKIILFIAFLSVFNGLRAQNELEIVSIREPDLNNYQVDDSINVVVTFRNGGPNTIFGSDLISFDVKITNSDTSLFFDIDRVANTNLATGDVSIYSLLSNVPLNTQNNYEVCVDVSGTSTYPNNTSKLRGPCVSFPVSLREVELKAKKIYYVEGQLKFEFDQAPQQARYRVLDLSGKVLKSGNLRAEKSQAFNFQPPANGLYFLQLQNDHSKPSTQKFIVR